jgi:SAM-dependent methyltransferase
MQKLSDLVNFKNTLYQLPVDPIQHFANAELSKILHLLPNDKLSQQLAEINNSFKNFETTLDQLKTDLQDQISEAGKYWLATENSMYDRGEVNHFENILKGRPRDELYSTPMKAILSKYSDWKQPAMIIRPGLDSYVDSMVSYDPLYLVDLSRDFLQPAMNRFNEKYQNRLRPYVVREDLDEPILKQLPDGQFGLCLAVHYFNYRPFEIIKRYLEEIYQKLKPGGVFIFSFNDCDRRSGVELVERFCCCYMPGQLMRQLVELTGFEINYSWNDLGPSTWMEVQRPGSVSSLKGGQTLAQILPILKD